MLKIKAFLLLIIATTTAYAGTVTGTLQGPSGLPVKNGTLNFVLQQAGLIVGAGSVVPTTASCHTSADGSVVGLPNPLTLPSVAITYGSGTMAAGIYYVVFTFYDASFNLTLASPELEVQLTSTGSLIISPPATFPPNAVGMTVFAGTVSGAETAQGNGSGLVLPVIHAVVTGGAIVAYQIINTGNGLTAAPVLTITDSSGSGATAAAVVSAGAVTQVNPGSAGSGYSSTPTVTASGGVSSGTAGGGGATGNNGGRLYADV
jgi:hypothetical protein